MKYLSTEQVIRINETQVGPDMVRDFNLLDSAVMRSRQSVMGQDAYPDIHTKAAALIHSLVQNHPFVDGNKRTALLADVAFYGINGYALNAPEPDVIHFVLDIATSQLVEVAEIAEPLRGWAIELPSNEAM